MTASFFVSEFEVSTLADVEALRSLVEEGEPAQKVGMVMQNHVILNEEIEIDFSYQNTLQIWKL